LELEIKIQQTNKRAVYLAYYNCKLLGEFRGYGKTDSERLDSAKEQAKATIKVTNINTHT